MNFPDQFVHQMAPLFNLLLTLNSSLLLDSFEVLLLLLKQMWLFFLANLILNLFKITVLDIISNNSIQMKLNYAPKLLLNIAVI